MQSYSRFHPIHGRWNVEDLLADFHHAVERWNVKARAGVVFVPIDSLVTTVPFFNIHCLLIVGQDLSYFNAM